MSDLLIKGIDMPKKGNIGLLLYSDGSVEICGTGSLSKPLYGVPVEKAIEIPPHGRCIDADRLADDFHAWLVTTSPFMQKSVADDMVETVRTAARIAPTILEASDNICPADDDDHSYEMQSDMRDHCERYEPTYNPEDGSM